LTLHREPLLFPEKEAKSVAGGLEASRQKTPLREMIVFFFPEKEAKSVALRGFKLGRRFKDNAWR
jgi:hypothetical protein